MTKSKQELYIESQKLIDFLNSQKIKSTLNEDSFRDYHVKIKTTYGTIILYHKPSKNSFSLSTHELPEPSKEIISLLWHQYNYPQEQNIIGLCAYVDGAYINEHTAWGLVLVENGKVIKEDSGLADIFSEEGTRQIAGEIQGVLAALNFAKENNISSITIFYDYQGLEMWATKKWKAQSHIAKFYIQQLLTYDIEITWVKICAHTGHIYNERADVLAKTRALQSE